MGPEPPSPGLEAMVRALRQKGSIRSPEVVAAMSEVDRREFLPPEVANEAYRDSPVVLKVDADGRPSSTISQPSMVALMLEELAVQAGDRVLEIGTASGYNAALLGALVGPTGSVVTVEIDSALAAAAAERLERRANVRVVVGDGRSGYEAHAPYDRVVVTAGAPRVAPAWRDQLVEGGRLVVPITGADRHGLCITFVKLDSELVECGRIPCGFVPLRAGA